MNREQDIQLTFNEIVRACDGDADWVVNVIEEEIISVQGSPREAGFSGSPASAAPAASAAISRPAYPLLRLSCNCWMNWKPCAKAVWRIQTELCRCNVAK